MSGMKEKTAPSSPLVNGKRVRKKNPKYTDKGEDSGTVLAKRKTPPKRASSTTKRSKVESDAQIKILHERKLELEAQLAAVNADLAIVNQKIEEKRNELSESLPNGVLETGIEPNGSTSTTTESHEVITPQEPEPVVEPTPPPTTTPRKPPAKKRAPAKSRAKTTRATPARGKRGAARPKAETTTPAAKLSPLDQCKKLLRALMNHRLAFPFNQPVDPVALQIPDYPLIIKHPMDFGTIKTKLESAGYSTVSAFTADVNLVFSNACTYNGPSTDVFQMANVLRDLFRKRIKPIEDKVEREEREKQDNAAAKESVDSASKEPKTEEIKPVPMDTTSAPEPQKQITVDSTPIKSSKPEVVPKPKTRHTSKTKKSQTQNPTSPNNGNPQFTAELTKSADKLKQQLSRILQEQQGQTPPKSRKSTSRPKKEPASDTPLTQDEKKKLLTTINSLTGTHLGMVVKIIKERMPNMANAKEIVIDIDSLDTPTFRQLEAYVNSIKKKRPKRRPKRPPTQPGAVDGNQASRIELAKMTELGTQSKIQDVERRLKELYNKSAALNRSAPSIMNRSNEDDMNRLNEEEPVNAEAEKSESESESGSSSDSDSSSDSGSSSDSDSSGSSDSDSDSETDSDSESEESNKRSDPLVPEAPKIISASAAAKEVNSS